MSVVPTLKALAEALRVNKSVKKVNLVDNKFGDEGVKAWGPWLGGAVEQWDSEGRWSQAWSLGSSVTWGRGVCMKHDVLGACLKRHFL